VRLLDPQFPETERQEWSNTVAGDLEQTIRDNAQGPAEVSGDAGTVKQHSLKEQIEADRYLASKAAVNKTKRGLKFNKLVPPGA